MASSFGGTPQKSFAPIPVAADSPGWRACAGAILAAEQARWILFAPVIFGGGIALWFLLPWVTERQAVVVVGVAIALFGLACDGLGRRVIVAGGLLLAAGVVVAEVRSLSVAQPKLYHRLVTADITGLVEKVERRAGGERTRILLLRDATDIDGATRVTIGFSGEVPPYVRPGARIVVPATLLPIAAPVMPGGYDPVRRAWFDGVAASGRAMGEPRLISSASMRPGGAFFANLRGDLADYLQKMLPGAAGAVAVALTIGEQGQVPVELVNAMRISGLVHLLTVSGFHVAVVVGGVMLVMRRLLALWPWLALRFSSKALAAIIAGMAGTIYVLLAGADVPAVRAGITAWIVIVAILIGRNPVSLRLIAFAALVILALIPEALMNPSFQLSFGAVTSLVLLRDSRLGPRLFVRAPDEGAVARLGRYVLLLLATGLAVELVITPIVLSHFGRSGLYGILANTLAIPLTSIVIMPLLGLFLLASLVGLGWAVAPLLAWSIDGLNGIALAVSAWPGATVATPMVPLHAYAWGVVGALILGLFVGRLRWLGLPPLVAGILLAFVWPRPDLLIAPDGRQVAIAVDGGLYTLRGHRGGFVVRNWAEATVSPLAGRIHDLGTARCASTLCQVPVGVQKPLWLLAGDSPPVAACAAADIVVAPAALPEACAPRWLKIDPVMLVKSGAVAIHADSRRFDSVARHAGDHPWSPSAFPGEQITLLGRSRWVGVLVE